MKESRRVEEERDATACRERDFAKGKEKCQQVGETKSRGLAAQHGVPGRSFADGEDTMSMSRAVKMSSEEMNTDRSLLLCLDRQA